MALAPPVRLPKVGSTIAGKYTLERVLGRGGMAVVYEATHIKLRQTVAIKLLLPAVCDLPDTVKRFEREARAAVQLRGPNVTRVLDVDATTSGLPFMVMEFLDGHDLSEEMQKRGQIPVDEAVGFVLQACSAMFEAHQLGIIHRDLKPSNLFVCEAQGGGRILKVLDFGIVKFDSGDTTVTRAETVLGTPAYMSPEQIKSAMEVDARTDIWSLGVILYELLACELPFEGASAPAMSGSILNDPPKALKPRRPDAPDGLIAAVVRALAKEPFSRWEDVKAFAEAIAPYGPVPKAWAPPAMSARGPSQPAPRPSRPEVQRAIDGELLESLDEPPRARVSIPRESVAPTIVRPSPDLWRTASAPRLTPAIGLGGLLLVLAVAAAAFFMGRGASDLEHQSRGAAPAPPPVAAASDAGAPRAAPSPAPR